MQNPLLAPFKTVDGTAPFSLIKEEHFIPAFDHAISLAKENIKKIETSSEEPTFKSVIVDLEHCSDLLGQISSIFFNLNSAETNDEIQKIAQEVSPKLSGLRNDILLNQGIFEKVKSIYNQKDTLGLDIEDAKLLEKTYSDFALNGAELNEELKGQLREVDLELSKLSLTFGENVLAATNAYAMIVEKEEELAGLPDAVKEAAAMSAKEKGMEGKWVFTLQYPSYIPFMTYAENEALRKELFFAFGSRCFDGHDNDNQEIVKQLVSFRNKKAKLLGFDNYADYILEKRMATSPNAVVEFLNDLQEKARPAAEAEVEDVIAYAKANGATTVNRWDWAFWSEKLKKEKFAIDDEALKPYFKLENVLNGVFEVANRLYDLNFTPRNDIDKYHEDVMTYEVTDNNGRHISIFYADFFPRVGKRGGAWMTSFRGQSITGDTEKRPHVSIVCNFTKPTETKPSLLTFNEVTTLFHEFGHALHGMLAEGKYESLTGTSVYWDFVELPSQVLENWCYERETLDLFAKHYETGEAIPQEFIDKIKASSTFLEGYQTLRQVSFGLLDMKYHQLADGKVEDVSTFEKEAMKPTSIDQLGKVEGTNMSVAFSHIFQGGYAAGYYSYKWAEVLDADAFELFKQKGIFDKETANSFKENVLSRGGIEDPMELYKRFRGQEPKVDALLRRAGLLK
ncbi:M3 family metallopeptidase [Flammeovirga yaeyamensis]|uniref:M3 family metallopeptidase n=1 Tax=Flammeovirga yaeyamensis TaxID=367791 RepID=A0AAX1N6S6_9BACT|nr:M3 family metallopeptidase [Flammeovirga yaeyamensis]MBB3697851.1 peptidyl-dipeptidase Dcp [Flammeovirga yaeyamensis]NMF35794.1 M3 family metallopeptidase [Flammeovirga yaeyamensis]QWG03254.1 M3 family metallopeptidase [Flammeovirga yaeyamensis]